MKIIFQIFKKIKINHTFSIKKSRGQEEIKIFKMKLDEVDRLIREQQYALSDRDLSKHLNCLEKDISSNNLINEQQHHHHSQYSSHNL